MLKNPEVIPLLLHMRWFGQLSASEIHLEISHPNSAQPHWTMQDHGFHKVLWDDVDDSDSSPFRKARLRLEGETSNGMVHNERLFALLEVNLDRLMCGESITFSPIPFGPNGKPNLAHEYKNGRKLKIFLQVAKAIFSHPQGTTWDNPTMVRFIREKAYFENDGLALSWLCELEKLAIIIRPNDLSCAIAMTAERFEQIFGIKIP